MFAAAIACVTFAAAHAFSLPLNATVVDGVLTLPDGTRSTVGNASSALNRVISTYFEGAVPSPDAVLVNRTRLSYLTLTGAYSVDEPISLPSYFVLVLSQAALTASSSLVGAAGLIVANGSSFSAVTSPGGPADGALLCPPGGPSPSAVFSLNSPWFTIDGLTIEGCGNDGCASSVHFTSTTGRVGVGGGGGGRCQLRHHLGVPRGVDGGGGPDHRAVQRGASSHEAYDRL